MQNHLPSAMRTRNKKPLVSYNEDDMFREGDEQEEMVLDSMYGRDPIVCSTFPERKPVWFKSDDTLNWNAGKIIVQALGWIVLHYEEDDESDDECEDESDDEMEESKQKITSFEDIKEYIADHIQAEFDGDIIGYCDEKASEYEENSEGGGGEEPLYVRLNGLWEDILGHCEEISCADSWDENVKENVEELLGIFCHAYKLQYIR